jgi:ribosomal protein S27AE
MTATYSNVGRRLRTLETLSDDGGDGCPRCRGTLLAIHDAVSGDLHRASWNGGEILPQELGQRRTETRCPQCGRGLTGDHSPVITIGGPRHLDA